MEIEWEPKLKWEPAGYSYVHRAAVLGGWIVRFYEVDRPYSFVFVPDPAHAWGKEETEMPR